MSRRDRKLTAAQMQFLSIRPRFKSDRAAAEALSLSASTVYAWRQHSRAFAEAYLSALDDNLNAARALTQIYLGHGVERLIQLLDAEKTVSAQLVNRHQGNPAFVSITVPDNMARLKAIQLLFQLHGLLRERHEHTGKDGSQSKRLPRR